MTNEKKIFEVEGVTLYDVDGTIFAEVNGDRNPVTFDKDDANRNEPLTRENVTEMTLYEDGGDRILPSDCFEEHVHYLKDWESEDGYARDEIAEFLHNYFEDEIEQGDENARDYWKDLLLDEIQWEYDSFCENNEAELEGKTEAEKKEMFLNDYLYGDNGEVLDYDEAMDELGWEDED